MIHTTAVLDMWSSAQLKIENATACWNAQRQHIAGSIVGLSLRFERANIDRRGRLLQDCRRQDQHGGSIHAAQQAVEAAALWARPTQSEEILLEQAATHCKKDTVIMVNCRQQMTF